jgi:cytochrome b561
MPRTYSALYRFMHWSIALCMTLLLITIFLRTTWMNKDHVADIIQQHMTDAGTPLERDQAIVLAKQIRAPMWDWHIYLGYTLVGLFTLRMALAPLGRMALPNPFRQQLSRREKFQFAIYLVFYVGVAVSLITGLLIEWGPRDLHEAAEEVHVLSIYYLLTFIVLHIGGVLLAEFTDDQGLVSRIVSGARRAA